MAARLRLLDKLHTYLPTLSAKPSGLTRIYTPSGDLLTDVEACILLSPKLCSLPRPFAPLHNYPTPTPAHRTILLKSIHGHGFVKAHVDQTILQMCRLKGLFAMMGSIDWNDAAQSFQSMIENHAFHTYSSNFTIVFAIDDLNGDLCHFLKAINEGISKERYDTYVIHRMKIHPLYKTLKRNPFVLRRLKIALRSTRTVEEVNLVLINDCCNEYKEAFSPILIPYEHMISYYNEMKGHIGFVYANTVYLPELFLYPMPSPSPSWM